MKEEFSASVCCAWDAVRITVENGAEGADGAGGVGLDASKTDLRGPGVGPLLGFESLGEDGNRPAPLSH
ncbi:hypothetical protein Stube_49240 [Streptomyces tubercidicus]|uniref:Uncharacterized protein n=1 Tax=Streptomyces tubercidicus TaxID=47759 RepID=A0A640UZZ4_9ACTN|nr:hypothetical protein Stube_49240 [Streptomyces tubercidicus]